MLINLVYLQQDLHYHEGEFLAKFPLIPGHEAVGSIAALGRSVRNVSLGDRVVIDPLQSCRNCFYCTRGQNPMCENLTGYGGTGRLESKQEGVS